MYVQAVLAASASWRCLLDVVFVGRFRRRPNVFFLVAVAMLAPSLLPFIGMAKKRSERVSLRRARFSASKMSACRRQTDK